MSRRKRQERSGYHHGNLKEALLAAARALIEEKGADGFTLAEAARVAGVSPAAPYRHFKDRRDLLGALAVAGFDRLSAMLEEAWQAGRPDPVTAFERVGRAYLTFSSENAAAYTAMFGADIDPGATPGLRTASGRTFDVLRTCSAHLLEELPQERRPPVDLMSLHIWSLSHGIATLFADGRPGRGRIPVDTADVLESGVLIYLRGLGLLPPDE